MFLNVLIFHAPWRLRKWQPSRTLGHAAESHQLKLQMVPEPNCFGTDDPEGIIGNSLSKTTTLSQKSRTTFTLPFWEARHKGRSLPAEPRCKLQMSVSSTPNAHFWCLPFLDDHFVDVESPFSGSRFPKPQYPLQNSLGWKVCASKNARRMVPDNVFVRKNALLPEILGSHKFWMESATGSLTQPRKPASHPGTIPYGFLPWHVEPFWDCQPEPRCLKGVYFWIFGRA